MEIWIIVAHARNRAIGLDGRMPWRLSSDLQRFKAATLGHVVLMGRKTFESMGGKPLPQRRNIVVSRTLTLPEGEEGVSVMTDVEEAIASCQAEGVERLFIIGGGQIYRAALPWATHLNLTLVEADISEADTYFPEINETEWHLLEEHCYPADERNQYAVVQRLYERCVRRV